MYIEEGLKTWAKLVTNSSPAKDLKKVQAWWFGMPVKFGGKNAVASRKGEAFELWGKEFAIAHGKALKAVMELA